MEQDGRASGKGNGTKTSGKRVHDTMRLNKFIVILGRVVVHGATLSTADVVDSVGGRIAEHACIPGTGPCTHVRPDERSDGQVNGVNHSCTQELDSAGGLHETVLISDVKV